MEDIVINLSTDELLDIFVCKICHLPSREPHLSICCGHTFCKSCLDNAKEAIPQRSPCNTQPVHNVCPMCHSRSYIVIPNKQVHSEIMKLQIFCSNKDKGCTWQDMISNINDHLKNANGCQFETVECITFSSALNIQCLVLICYMDVNRLIFHGKT